VRGGKGDKDWVTGAADKLKLELQSAIWSGEMAA